MLDFFATHKAMLAQTSVANVLTYGGYRVAPIGVEARCPDIVPLSKTQYDALALPAALRTTPDLSAFAPPSGPLILAEVKYTAHWTAATLALMTAKLQRQ